jgi:hypothetical protein
MVDDGHYLDTFSWLVLKELAENWTSCPLLLVLLNWTAEQRSATSSAQQDQDRHRV